MRWIALTIIFLPTLILATSSKEKVLTYKNAKGSLLTLVFHQVSNGSGEITGTLTTATANKKCLAIIGKPRPISGFYTGNALAFSVSYPNCGMTTAWVGNLSKDCQSIGAFFLDAHRNTEIGNKTWKPSALSVKKYQRSWHGILLPKDESHTYSKYGDSSSHCPPLG